MTSPPDKAAVEAAVRESLDRLLTGKGGLQPARPIIDANAVGELPEGARFDVPPDALVTPLARQVALERRITLAEARPLPEVADRQRAVALAADHGGFQLKEALKGTVEGLGWLVIDCGTHSPESVDYPDYAFAAARLVAEGRAAYAIIVDGAGIGSCMAANKVPGIRAAMCYDLASAANSREHNHANVLTLGAGLIGPSLAQQIVKVWLETPFGPGRHARRVEKISAIERRFLKR